MTSSFVLSDLFFLPSLCLPLYLGKIFRTNSYVQACRRTKLNLPFFSPSTSPSLSPGSNNSLVQYILVVVKYIFTMVRLTDMIVEGVESRGAGLWREIAAQSIAKRLLSMIFIMGCWCTRRITSPSFTYHHQFVHQDQQLTPCDIIHMRWRSCVGDTVVGISKPVDTRNVYVIHNC